MRLKEENYQKEIAKLDIELEKINNNISKKLIEIEKIVNAPKTIKEFDKETFDSIVERVIIGEDENGNFVSNDVRFILKTGMEYRCENKGIGTSVSFGSYKRIIQHIVYPYIHS